MKTARLSLGCPQPHHGIYHNFNNTKPKNHIIQIEFFNDTCAWTPNSIVFCSSLLWNLLLLRLGAGLGKSRQVQASGIVSMYEWMDVWRRAHLSTGASREAPVDNECFSPILTTRNPGISGSCIHTFGAMARSTLVHRCLARGTCGQ